MEVFSFIAKGLCIGSVIYGIHNGFPWHVILICFIIGSVVYGLVDDDL